MTKDTTRVRSYDDHGSNSCLILSSGSVKEWMCMLGLNMHGTEAHSRGSPFPKTDHQYNGTSKVPVSSIGMYAAYFLEEECGLKATPEQDASSCTIYHICARNGYQGYIRLSTNLPGVEPNKWVLYHPRTKTYGSDTAAADTRLESNTRRLTRMLLDQHFFAKVHVLSEKQREDAIWRLLRETVAWVQVYEQCYRAHAQILQTLFYSG